MLLTFITLALVSNFAAAEMAIPDELKEYIKDLHDYCLHQLSLKEDDHLNYDIHDKDPKMMCYMKCLMISSKWMTADEKIDYDFIINSAHPAVKPILLPALNKCRDITGGAMECEKAYNFNMCLYNADPENWFFV